MATRKLDKKEWKTFFDRISKILEGKQAEIEVVSLGLGDQVQAEWIPLYGIAYDPKDDLVEVILEGLDHMIAKPREIYVEDGTAGLESVEIIDAEGIKQIVKLRDELES